MSQIKYELPQDEWNWKNYSFDFKSALNHLNSFLMEHREFRESVYEKSLLVYKLRYGIAGMEFIIGRKRVIFLILIRNGEAEINAFLKLKCECEARWNETHDENDIVNVIKNTGFGKAWFAKIDMNVRRIEISSKKTGDNKEKLIMRYFKMIDFMLSKIED